MSETETQINNGAMLILLQAAPVRGEADLIDLLSSLRGEDRVNMAESLSLVLISQSLPSDIVSGRIQRVLDGLEWALTRQADQMFPPVIELPRCEAERTGYLRSLLRLQQEGQDVIGDLVDELDLRLAAAPEEEMPKCRP